MQRPERLRRSILLPQDGIVKRKRVLAAGPVMGGLGAPRPMETPILCLTSREGPGMNSGKSSQVCQRI